MFHKKSDPTRFPYVTEARLHTGVSSIEFPIAFATADAFTAFKMNAKNLDAIALRDVAKERREAGLTLDDVKATIKDGATFIAKVELALDGGEYQMSCVRCLKLFQPVQKPKANGGFSGNFRTLKAEEVAKLDEVRQNIATETTVWVLNVETMPADLKTRAVPVCADCKRHETESLVREKARLEREGSDRKPFFPPYLVASDVQDALYARDSAITNAINRKTYDEVVGHRGNRRLATDNRGAGNGRGDRTRGPRKSWNGVELFPSVADTLTRLVSEGKLDDSIESLLAMAPAELEALGVQNAPRIQQLAQSHADWTAREEKKRDFAHKGRVLLGDAVSVRR